MGLFRVTLIPEEVGVTPIVLCDSGDPLPTMNIRLNTQPVYQFEDLFRASFAVAFFRGNRRNILSFGVTRTKDETMRQFSCPGAALIHALKFTNVLPGISRAKIEIRDRVSGTFFMENTAAQQTEMTDVRGVKLGYQFVLNGGEITAS